MKKTFFLLITAMAAITAYAATTVPVEIVPGAPQFDCEDRSNLLVPFELKSGDFSTIKEIRFVDTIAGYDKPVQLNKTDMQMTLLIGGLKPGTYPGELRVRNYQNQTVAVCPFRFDVWFESTIFKHKYYNVLAVYTDSLYNDGYAYSAYQWYWLNQADTLAPDGETVIDPVFKPISGATASIYHQTEELVPGDEYYVVLTYTDKLNRTFTVRSCPQLILNKHPEPEESEDAEAPARKFIKSGKIMIEKDEHTYDIYGNKVD